MHKAKVFLFRLGPTLGVSVIMLICGESILRQNIGEVFKWMAAHPVVFLLNLCMLFSLMNIFVNMTSHLGKGALITSIFYSGACIVSFYKFRISGEYLIPQDVILIGEAGTISKEMDMKIEYHVITNVLANITLLILAFKWNTLYLKWNKLHIKKKKRVFSTLSFLMIFMITAILGPKGYASATEMNEQNRASLTVNEDYNEKGFLMGFSDEVGQMMMKEPEGYTPLKAIRLLQNYTLEEPNQNFKKPNIIMIMSEGFFQVNDLPNVMFSENPIAYFDQIREEFSRGKIITSIYGGRTAQTEYEVLTGNSVIFTGPQNMAYMRLVNQKLPSIANDLKEEGYTTLAIHSYEKTFFSRDVAYPFLGIDTFIAAEDFENPKLARGYISDEALVDEVIAQYENNKEGPLFVHAVTMQNHMPYVDEYDANGIKVTSDVLSLEEKNILQTYANGIADSDQALKKLIDYFSTVEEPTIILMYGDHLPALNAEYGIYKKTGYISEEMSQKDYFKLYQTPFILWDNYGLETKDFGYIDASYLGSTLFDHVGYTKDPYMNFLQEVKKEIKAYHPAFLIDKNGNFKSLEEANEEEASYLTKLWWMQYHRILND